MFGSSKPSQAKSPGAAIAFLSGKKYKPTDKVMADDGDTSDEGFPGKGVSSPVAPPRQASASDMSQDPSQDDGDLKAQIDELIDQYGAQAVQDQMDQCMQEEQNGDEADEMNNGTDSGSDMSAVDPSQG